MHKLYFRWHGFGQSLPKNDSTKLSLKVVEGYFETISECSLLSPVSKNVIKTIGHLCLQKRYKGQILPDLCLSRACFMVHVTFCGSWKQNT